jgi:beta-N-acetylhexosaminidase
LFRNKKVIVFAFNAPYYLDSTDLSKISAYYALYSKTAPFVEVAIRILFQELNPGGALPVSVPGAGYDLRTVLSPDPTQVISLEVDQTVSPAVPTPGTTITPKSASTPSATPTPLPTVKVGDTLPLRTGVILDHNHNPVPDGTPVRFIFTPAGAENGVVQQISAVTVGGIARTAYRIQSGGSLEIRVVSEPAETSKLLRVNITSSGVVGITPVNPTLPPPTPTLTPTPSSTPTLTPTATPTPTPRPPVKANTDDWLLSLVIAWAAGAAFFWLGRMTGSLRWAVRWGLLAIAGGLLAYSYVAGGLPGGGDLLESSGRSVLFWFTLLGAFSGWLIGLLWRRQWEKDHQQPGKRPG